MYKQKEISMNERINIGDNAFILPEPMTIVGSHLDGKPNFMALAWVTRLNYKPCLMGIAVNKGHATHKAISESRQFSINLPSVDMVEITDYVGLASGKRTDKSQLFDIHYGALDKAPLIKDCPLSLEMELEQTVDLATNTLFVGKLKAAWTEERFLAGGHVDIEKARPMTLSMPDNHYWAVGEKVGRAWRDGKKVRDRLKAN